MAQLGQTFDANNVDPSAPREVLPAGKYLAQIVQSEMKETKARNGEMLNLEMEIMDGEFARRRIWDRLNLVNPNAQAVEIAQRTLSAICHATGQMTITDSEQLHFKPMLVTVKVRPAGKDKQGIERDAQNEVGGYEAAPGVQGSRPASQGQPPRTFAASAPAAKSPPWRRSAA